MKKIIVIISLFLTSIFADSFLGKAILAPTLKPHHETKNYSKNIDNPPTKLKDKHSKYRFKKDNHRYDKRYKYFDYDRYGYYNNDGYYYGYFDATGYFLIIYSLVTIVGIVMMIESIEEAISKPTIHTIEYMSTIVSIIGIEFINIENHMR